MNSLVVTLIVLQLMIGYHTQELPNTEIPNTQDAQNLILPTFILRNEQNTILEAPTFRNALSSRSVVIVGCSITAISANAFYLFTNMTDFTFTQNSGVNNLPDTIFNANRNLENIYLVRNNLTSLGEKTFETLLNLRHLDVSMNKISSLTPNIFNSSIMLTKFLIQRNDLKELPEGIFDNANRLKVINLSYNKIKRISSNLFKYNYQLETVALQGNKIKHLDYGIEHLNIKTFNLHSNPLDLDNKKVIEVLKFLHSNDVKTGIHLPHHKQNFDAEHEKFSASSNYLLIILISVTVLLSVLVGYLIYIVKVSKHGTCMRYHNMQTLSREDLVPEDPWIETEINGNIIRSEN